MTQWLVLPSPFLGTAAYAPLVAALGHEGDDSSVAMIPEPLSAGRLMDLWAETAAGLGDVVLVPHSNAGHLAPGVSASCGGLPIVFTDAALPASFGASALVPPGLLSMLADLVDADGLLPAWTRWWPREDVAPTLPGDWFDRIELVVPQVPFAYAEETITVPDDWERGRCGYLAFGAETYAEELARAGDLGWPMQVLADTRHLHCLTEPDETADAIRSVRALVG